MIKQTAQVSQATRYLTIRDVRELVDATLDFPDDTEVLAGVEEDKVERIDLIRFETQGADT